MSCPSEFEWSVYVDGELSREEQRGVEMHLVSCRECRYRVVTLRDEAVALTSALIERVPVSPSKPPVPAEHLSWSLPIAVAAVTAVLSISGILIEMRLPGVLDLLNPRRLMGVYEMVFDAVFMLKNRLPELFDAAASVGAMAAFSLLGCAVLHALSRRITKTSSMLLLFVLILSAPDAARALDFRRDGDTHVAAREIISETLVCTGDVVTVDGTIDGDLVVAAERFTLRGTVTGNLFVFGGEVEIDGSIEGSVVSIGKTVRLGGSVDGGATLVGKRLSVMDDARIERDVTLLGEGARIAGAAGRDVTFAGEWIEVRAEITRDLHVLGAEHVVLLDAARVGRDVRARLWGHDEEVERAPGASVVGEVAVAQESMVREHYLAHYQHVGFYVMLLMSAAAAFVYGLLIYLFDPRLFEAELPDGRAFVRSLGTGFVVVLAGPVALGLIGLTVIGIPIAVIGFFILLSALYTSYVLVAGMVGQSVFEPRGSGPGAFAPSLLVGVLIVSAVAALPFIGPAIRILTVLFGMGCLFERVRGMRLLNQGGLRS
jgi:Putative zinc-finger